MAASKFAYHLPLYRQSVIYTRDGVEIEADTMGYWLCRLSWLLNLLVDAVRRYTLSRTKVHDNDTRLPLPAPGNTARRPVDCWSTP